MLLLQLLLLLVPPGRDIRRPRKLPAIATKAAGRQQRNESKNLQLAGPAERERREDEQELKEGDEVELQPEPEPELLANLHI